MPRTKLFDEQEVLEKAMYLFWKQGYYATSIQDLVTHLGINRASLYDTYGGKKELFDRAFRHYRVSGGDGLRQFLNAHEDVKLGLRKLFNAAIEQAALDKDRKGCFVVNTTVELIPNDLETLAILQDNKALFEKIVIDYLSIGVEKGQISKDKDLQAIASLMFTLYNGLKVVSKINTNTKEFCQSMDMVFSLLD